MSKKLASAICCSVLVISCGICSLGYILGDSSHPWWLIVLAGGITCAIVSMANGVKEETDETKKSSKFIGTICASKNVSLASILQREVSENNTADIIVITEKCQERLIKEVVNELENCSVNSIIRVSE